MKTPLSLQSKIHPAAHAALVCIAAFMTLAQTGWGQTWTLIENFTGLTENAALSGQNGWTNSTNTSGTVGSDPADTNNLVGVLQAGNQIQNYKNLAIVGTNQTATMFLRFRIGKIDNLTANTNESNGFMGVSDAATPTAFTNFRAQWGVNPTFSTTNTPPTTPFHLVSTGSPPNKFLNQQPADSLWYHAWVVLDKTNAKYSLYLQGGKFTTRTLVTEVSSNTSAFDFRNGGNLSDTETLKVYLRSGVSANHQAPLYVDDIYLASGENLTPPVATISASGSLAAVSTTYGTASAASATTVAVSGGSLTSNITATAPPGFEVSSDGTTFGPTATFTQSGGSASGNLSLRLASTAAAGTYSNQTVSLTAGSASNSVAIATSTVSPGVLASNQITLTPGVGGAYTASGPEGSTFSIGYSGRTANGITTTYSSATAPSAAGYYIAMATATGNYTGSNSTNYFITGPVAVADAVSKLAAESAIVIEGSSLLVNDRLIDDAGAAQTTGFSLTSATSGLNNLAQLDGSDVLFEVTGGSSPWVFTYLITDPITAKTSTGTVTVSDGAVEQAFQLQIIRVGAVTYNSGTDTTSQQVEFIGVPNNTLLVETTTNLSSGPWTSLGNQSTGATGSFVVTVSASGNQVATWPASRFFRAKLVP